MSKTLTAPSQTMIGLGCKYPDGDNGEGDTYASVSLDEIRVWNHVWLTEEQIYRVYSNNVD